MIGECNKILYKNGEMHTEDTIILRPLDDVFPFAQKGLIDTEDSLDRKVQELEYSLN